MLHRMLPIAALGLVRLSIAQDTDAPASFRGVWEGTLQSGFAQANPSVPNSYECLPDGSVASISHRLEIGQYDVTWGDWKEWKERKGSSTWLFPAGKGKKFTWSTYDNDIVRLRSGPETLECYWMKVDGKGKSRKLSVVTLGGAAYSWQDQCGSAAYKAVKDVGKKPTCVSATGSRSPLKSTVLGTYSYKGGGNLEGSGASATAVAAVTALAAVMLGARLL